MALYATTFTDNSQTNPVKTHYGLHIATKFNISTPPEDQDEISEFAWFIIGTIACVYREHIWFFFPKL